MDFRHIVSVSDFTLDNFINTLLQGYSEVETSDLIVFLDSLREAGVYDIEKIQEAFERIETHQKPV